MSYWLDRGTETVDEIARITTDMVEGINKALFES